MGKPTRKIPAIKTSEPKWVLARNLIDFMKTLDQMPDANQVLTQPQQCAPLSLLPMVF